MTKEKMLCSLGTKKNRECIKMNNIFICKHPLRLYGNIAHLPDVDPAHRVVSV